MGYKTVLVHCDGSPKVVQRLAVAVALAKRQDAHLIGVHIREPIVAPAMFDGTLAMDNFFAAFEETAKEELATAKAAFEKAAAGQQLSTEWRAEEGYADQRLSVQARYADLAVVGQADSATRSSAPLDLPESLALSAGRPVLVIPHVGSPTEPPRTVMLCWNGSRESARAAADALPLLQAADKVIVLCVDLPSSQAGADAAAWLARHGVKATVQRERGADSDVGGVILSRAADLDVDLIVMGLYGHSRLRETVLGGASRTLLASMTVPVFMAH